MSEIRRVAHARALVGAGPVRDDRARVPWWAGLLGLDAGVRGLPLAGSAG